VLSLVIYHTCLIHFSFVGCWLLVVGCWLLVVGCWLLVVGCWLLVVGCWLLVVGCWLSVIGQVACQFPRSLFTRWMVS
jgi:membrane-bound ClpP family serine protease